MMGWNYLSSPLENLRWELVLLLLALVWLPLRLLGAVVKRVEEGKPVVLRILGKELVEVENSSSARKRGGKNT